MIYRQFYPIAGKLYLTLVHRDFDADVYFSEINYSEWEEISREDHFDEKKWVQLFLSQSETEIKFLRTRDISEQFPDVIEPLVIVRN